MKSWLLVALSLVLLSGCAGFKTWLAGQDTTKLTAELKLLEQLLNDQAGRNLNIPLDLGKELSKRGLQGK